MKMQMWKFLVFPAIDNQPVRSQMILSNQTLCGSDEVRQEWVGRLQLRKRPDSFFWNDDNVEWVIWLWVKKSQQGVHLTYAFNGDEKGGMVQHPDKNLVEEGVLQQTENVIHPQS